MTATLRHTLSLLALSTGAFVAASATSAAPAHAEIRVHIGGSAHVRVGGGVRVRVPQVRWYRRHYAPPPPHVAVSGHIWLGGGYYSGPNYAPPPPPAPTCDCGPSQVPSYYPVSAPPVAYASAAPVPALSRWGVGVFAGGVDVEGQPEGSDLGLLGRYRLSPSLAIEGEIGKTELASGARVDRRLGAGLVWEAWAHNRLAPYLVGSVGVTQAEVGGDWSTNQNFGELGVGLRWRVTPSIDLAADVRAGSRSSIADEAPPTDVASRMLAPSTDSAEEYSRARLSALINF